MVPILVTAFNRPFQLKECLSHLSNLRNPIYISIDGARKTHPEDEQLVAECVEIAKEFLEFKDRVHLNDRNLGLYRAVTSAIDRLFLLYESLIIIEDDILISQDAVFFYENCLENFRDQINIGGVSAINYVPKEFISDPTAPYRLSNYAESWGWATWSDRWQSFRYESSDKCKFLDIPREIRSISTWLVWRKIFRDVYLGKSESWAYRWMYSNWIENRKFLVSNQNLTSNIGFGAGATNTKHSIFIPEVENLNRDRLLTWKAISHDSLADNWLTRNHFRTNFMSRVCSLFKKMTSEFTAN